MLFHKRSIQAILCFVIAFFPVIALLLIYVSFGAPEIYSSNDNAILEINTIKASQGLQYTGAYSRFGWNHLGPIFSYLSVPFYLLLDKSYFALLLTAFVINVCAVYAMLLIAYMFFHSKLLSFVLVFFLIVYLTLYLHVNNIGSPWPYDLSSTWNPHVPILMYGVFILSCAAFSSGEIKLLPLIVFTSSLLVQEHISYVLVVGILILVSVVLYWLQMKKRGVSLIGDGSRRWFVFSFILFVLIWAPPIYEQLTNYPGNFARIGRFFFLSSEDLATSESISFLQYLIIYARKIVAVLLSITLHSTVVGVNNESWLNIVALVIFVALSIILVCSVFVNIKREHIYLFHLQVLLLVCIIVNFLSLFKIKGEVHEYLVVHNAIIGLLAITSVCVTFIPDRVLLHLDAKLAGKNMLLVCTTLLSLTLTSNIVESYTTKFSRMAKDPPSAIRVFSAPIISTLQRHSIHSVTVAFDDQKLHNENYSIISGTIVALYKAGIQLEGIPRAYGLNFAPSNSNNPILVIGYRKPGFKLNGITKYQTLVEHGAIFAGLYTGESGENSEFEYQRRGLADLSISEYTTNEIFPNDFGNMSFHVDRFLNFHGKAAIEMSGWGFIKEVDSKNSEMYISVQTSKKNYLFETKKTKRVDVSRAYGSENHTHSGFYTVIDLSRVKGRNKKIGLYIRSNTGDAFRAINSVSIE